MRTLYQLRIEGPKRSFDADGHFYSQRVFASAAAAEAFVPEFSGRCCGEGLWDLASVTSHKIVELRLHEEDEPSIVNQQETL